MATESSENNMLGKRKQFAGPFKKAFSLIWRSLEKKTANDRACKARMPRMLVGRKRADLA